MCLQEGVLTVQMCILVTSFFFFSFDLVSHRPEAHQISRMADSRDPPVATSLTLGL